MNARRTKIIATLGPATDDPATLDQLLAAGVNCARVNCSHGDGEALAARAEAFKAARERSGRPAALMFDIQGPKIRLSAETEAQELVAGQRVVLAGAPATGALYVEFPQFAELCGDGSRIVIGDGSPVLEVEQISVEGLVSAHVVTPGRLGPRKGVSVAFAQANLPAITAKDERDIVTAVEAGADFVALSFVRGAADIDALRARLRALGSPARVIAKIEKIEAYQRLDEIIAAADALMVARGDYGVEAGISHVPLMQKDVVRRATAQGKLVIVATEMLESMISAPRPTRAEAADVANAVIDGTSAVMLSAETGVGSYPVEAVRMMAEIAEAAEAHEQIYHEDQQFGQESPDAAVMHSAVRLGRDADAAALVVPTTSGGTARTCAKYRPRRAVIALCHQRHVADQLALEWGVYPRVMDVIETVEEMIERSLELACEMGVARGELVVVTAGPAAGSSGATNLITLRQVL